MALRTYRLRLYPSRKQKSKLLKNFDICKEVYNTLISESKELQTTKKFDFNSIVKDIKITCNKYYSQVYSQVLQNVSDRASKAFDNFFRRLKERKSGKKVKAGYPRYKSRINSITYPQSGFKFVNGKKLFVSKIGSIPIILHRMPKGIIKTMAIKVNKASQWFACFTCEIDIPRIEHPHKDKQVGIDVGLTNFATLTNQTSIPNPRNLIRAEKKLKMLHRRLNKKQKGSSNRKKAIYRLARQHLKIINRRSDWQHKLSKSLAQQFGRISAEKLNIKGMARNHCLAKHIHDASWGSFIGMLSYKVVTHGGELVKNPKTRGSSKRCNKCGNEEHMPLGKEIFTCTKCGSVSHRDINAALNHIKDTAGLVGISTPVDIKPLPSHLGMASSMAEAGTICQKT